MPSYWWRHPALILQGVREVCRVAIPDGAPVGILEFGMHLNSRRLSDLRTRSPSWTRLRPKKPRLKTAGKVREQVAGRAAWTCGAQEISRRSTRRPMTVREISLLTPKTARTWWQKD